MITDLNDQTKIGPNEMVEVLFHGKKPELEEFYLDLGATKEFPQGDAIFPNVFKNLGRFDFNDIVDASEIYSFEFDEFGQTPYGTLIEHVPTGYIFALIPDEEPAIVYDYDDSRGWPTNIVVEPNTDWIPADSGSNETRVGGATNYSLDAWPHFDGFPMDFVGQYKLEDGRFIHIFIDEENDSWKIQNGGNCALVEGGPVPYWIEIKPVEERDNTNYLMRHPHKTFSPVRPDSKAPAAPSWILGDQPPTDAGYKFLWQFGDDVGDGTESYSFGYFGDMYLFYKESTSEALVLWQCG